MVIALFYVIGEYKIWVLNNDRYQIWISYSNQEL